MTLNEKLAQAQQDLESLREAYQRVLTAQSWEQKDGEASRSVTNVSLATLVKEIARKEKEIENLEARIDGVSPSAFRVGVKF